ncbi:MAG: cupin-like domain-containing protein [Burkholderiales bacterium]
MSCPSSGDASRAHAAFRPLPASTFRGPNALREQHSPAVFRGLAAAWPAVQQWRFSDLADRVPDRNVQLVVGNREHEATCFVESSLSAYLRGLASPVDARQAPAYLKEFDLLQALPALRQDLKHAEIFPGGVTQSLQSWIGPAGARTGLHHDYLNNLAVQIVGRKRFYLLHPATVERLGAVSPKYDAWARLSSQSAQTLAAADPAPSTHYAVVDLEPGDVLYVPAHWWHEVHNLSASILFGGFYGPRAAVAALWVGVGLRNTLHRLGWLGQQGCTCHPELGFRSPVAATPPPARLSKTRCGL